MNAVRATVDVAADDRFPCGTRIALIGTPDNPKISRPEYSTNSLLMATTCQTIRPARPSLGDPVARGSGTYR